MKHVVIENPILNSPFGELQRHFKFFGKWAFPEKFDPWNIKTEIKKLLDKLDKVD